jgi:hypothetical protein
MPLHFVFTKYEGSWISRAIMWFEWPKGESDRRCSHGMIKFFPEGPIFKGSAMAAEAMERGCWINFYKKALGRQDVVADFRLRITDDEADEIMRKALLNYNDWAYDFFGVGQNAIIILAKKWFGSIWRWLQISWKLRKGEKSLFCTGYLYNVAYEVMKEIHSKDQKSGWTGGLESPREATPREMIKVCFEHPECYEWMGGIAKP